jgi:hypothetical protein
MAELPSASLSAPGSGQSGSGQTGSGQRGSTLGLRLALAFLGVSLAAVALLAVLAAVFSAVDVSSLGNRQRTELASAFAVAAAGSWNADRGWAGADLSPVIDVAGNSGVQLQVRDTAGHPIATTSGFTAAEEPRSSKPIVVKGDQVGTVQVGLTASGLGAADNVLRTALLRAIAGTDHRPRPGPAHHPPRQPSDHGDPGDGERRPVRAGGPSQRAGRTARTRRRIRPDGRHARPRGQDPPGPGRERRP